MSSILLPLKRFSHPQPQVVPVVPRPGRKEIPPWLHTNTYTTQRKLKHTHSLTHARTHMLCLGTNEAITSSLVPQLLSLPFDGTHSHTLLPHALMLHMHTHTHAISLSLYLSHFFSLLLPNVFPHSVSLMRLLLPPTHPCTHSHSHAHSLHPIKHIFRKTLKQFGSVHPSINHVNHLQTSHRGKKINRSYFAFINFF